MHDEVEQHAEEDLAAGAVQVQDGALLGLVTEDLLRLLANALQSQHLSEVRKNCLLTVNEFFTILRDWPSPLLKALL